MIGTYDRRIDPWNCEDMWPPLMLSEVQLIRLANLKQDFGRVTSSGTVTFTADVAHTKWQWQRSLSALNLSAPSVFFRADPHSPHFWPTTRSGTTAVVALFRDGRIWVANAGDSRAVLGVEDMGVLFERDGGEESTLVRCCCSSFCQLWRYWLG